jgi:hypothetical protein
MKRTLIALSAALVLGALGAASTAQASDNSGEYSGGSVVPGSTAVNPVYHPRWFANGSKAYGFVPSTKRPQTAPQPLSHQDDNYGPEAGKD